MNTRLVVCYILYRTLHFLIDFQTQKKNKLKCSFSSPFSNWTAVVAAVVAAVLYAKEEEEEEGKKNALSAYTQ